MAGWDLHPLGAHAVYANQDNDLISTGAGNDTIVAGMANDNVLGNEGNDLLIGSAKATTR